MSSQEKPARGRITIHDLARACGVSATTVSHAFNGKRHVEPGNRARILAAAKSLGYQPSRLAQSLRASKTGVIALMLPNMNGESRYSQEFLGLDYYMQLAAAAAAAALERDYPLMLVPGGRNLEDFRNLGVDGAILCDPDAQDPRLRLCEAIQLPVVTIGRDTEHDAFSYYVCANTGANTRAMLTHMHRAGARRIALLGTASSTSWTKDSELAYLQWCAEMKIPSLVVRAALRDPQASARDAALGMLQAPDRPDAILAIEETHGIGVLQAAQRLDLQVGRDLLLAAGIESAQARNAAPPLTTIDLRPDLQGVAAVELLLARISGQAVAAPRIIPSHLNIRASTVGV